MKESPQLNQTQAAVELPDFGSKFVLLTVWVRTGGGGGGRRLARERLRWSGWKETRHGAKKQVCGFSLIPFIVSGEDRT